MNPEREIVREQIFEMLQLVYMLRGRTVEQAEREAALMLRAYDALQEERLRDIQQQRDDFNSGKVTP